MPLIQQMQETRPLLSAPVPRTNASAVKDLRITYCISYFNARGAFHPKREGEADPTPCLWPHAHDVASVSGNDGTRIIAAYTVTSHLP